MDVLFTDLMDGIVILFNKNQGKIWPKWAFRSRSSILGQAPRFLPDLLPIARIQ